MIFTSNIFLFLFLPLFLAVYYMTPRQWKSLTILVGSYIFYAWWRVDFLLLFAGVKLWNHVCAKQIIKHDWDLKSRRWMQIGVIGNLLVLGLFKYWNFGMDSLALAIQSVTGDTTTTESLGALRFILPIGISFYIFQSISFIIDVYRKDAPPASNFLDFAAFIALFPQLIAGPVLRYKDMVDQFTSRTHTPEKFGEGARRFMIGFARKVLIADSVASLADSAFALEDPSMADAWLGALSYTIQLYFDFSGYADMAIGLGLMMGFRFVENFNAPYVSRSITEFWRRWHISLSSWLRDYLYIPLGGNRKGTLRTYINLFLTMLLGGLWHGANATFILWGAWHGAILAIERAFGVKGETGVHPLSKPHLIALTLLLTIIGWVMFRAPDVEAAFTFYQAMAGLNGIGLSDAFVWQVQQMKMELCILAIAWFLVYLKPVLAYKRTEKIHVEGGDVKKITAPSLMTQAGFIALFLLAVTKLSAESYSPFLYFQF